jgi:hypothetical protein
LVEQRTFNPLVAGSNPARPTKRFKDLGENLGLFSFLHRKNKSLLSIAEIAPILFARRLANGTAQPSTTRMALPHKSPCLF